ncbi:preprotein translocase subunit SecE [Candidatus Peregrinibacteria bacterium]|nr:preprotein translocase subunit SecE [Candidatus Peregrinibacteria bacterium]
MKAFTNYIRASFEELTRVTWPTRNQAVKLTILVFIFCLIAAVIVGAFDFGFNELYSYLLKLAQ